MKSVRELPDLEQREITADMEVRVAMAVHMYIYVCVSFFLSFTHETKGTILCTSCTWLIIGIRLRKQTPSQ